jgi:hypothetical protein
MRNGCVASGRVKSDGWTSYSVVLRAPRLNPPSVLTVRLLGGKFKGGAEAAAATRALENGMALAALVPSGRSLLRCETASA